jgi:hypothetical protein
MHALAEHVLAAARYASVQRIGLTVVDGGIATPPFGADNRSIALLGSELVIRSDSGVKRAPATTLRAAGEFVGIAPGGPSEVYTLATPCDLDAVLDLDAVKQIVDWYSLGASALHRLRMDLRMDIEGEEPSDVTLWPEHFDAAIRSGDTNYGVLAGDATISEPYLYVGPATVPNDGSQFWNQPFGATRSWSMIASVDDALTFYREGHRQLLGV